MSVARRDILKLCGAAFVASLLPDQLIKLLGARDLRDAMERLDQWDLPAHAASNADYTAIAVPPGKTIWNGQLNTDMPDLYVTHGMPRIPQFGRTSYGGAVLAEWPDETTVPNSAWYALFASSLLADTSAINQCRQGWFSFDLESFPVSTQAERLTAADNFVTVYENLRAVVPNLRFGFYAYPNINSNLAGYDHGDANYLDFQSRMEDMAVMYETDCEVIFPKLYTPYTRSVDDPQSVSALWKMVVHEIQDTYRMIRAYGHGQKIYPAVNYTRAAVGCAACTAEALDGTKIVDQDIFEQYVRLCYQLADGFQCWGGFTTAWSQESALPWWANVVEPIALGRKPGGLRL